MKIRIEASNRMNAEARTNWLTESRSIRVPKELRKSLNAELGDHVALRANNGKPMSFWISEAYMEDVKRDPLCIYVVGEAFEQVAITAEGACELDVVNDITLGCDPELVIIDKNDGSMISAQNFFGLNKFDAVGYDGNLLELRPAPSINEKGLTETLFALINQARLSLNRCTLFPNTMMAGISSFKGRAAVARNIKANTVMYNHHNVVTAGFHLHYGLPQEILGFKNRLIASQVVKALDFYVGIPAVIPEGYEDSYRRGTQGLEYGKPGMYRLDHRTLEYRTPGAALMKHPILAQGLIGLGAVVIEDIVSRVKTITSGFKDLNEASNDADIRALYPDIPPAMEIFRSICSPTTDVAKSHLPTIVDGIQKMVGYDKRADSIINFFNHIETKFSVDVEDNWRRYWSNGQRQQG